MRPTTTYITGLMIAGLAATTLKASDASTTASVTSGRRSGTAAATAEYEGDVGLARTRTKTGKVNLARGVAVGVDEDGLTLSVSHAVAAKSGPAYAGTFNLSIGRDGQVSSSYGGALSTGGRSRSALAGGSATTSRRTSSAIAFAKGKTRGGGIVKARTHSYSRRPIATRRVVRHKARGVRWR
jgi:hypothetical protein